MADDRPQLNFRVFPDELKGLDDLRRLEPDLPNRSEMMRRLLARALEVAARQGKISKTPTG